MAKVKFIKDAFVSKKLFAKKGEIKDIEPDSSVRRWLRRGHELVEDGVKEEVIEESPVVEEEVVESIETAVDLDVMSKDELLVFAEDNAIEIDKRLGVKKIREKIEEWLNDNSEGVEDSF